MPNYAYMIAKAVDVVARKLAGMDPENASRVTQALSDEAKVISDELQHSGQRVDQEILAARLEGLVTRMKYEMRNHVSKILTKNILTNKGKDKFRNIFIFRNQIHHHMNFLYSTFHIIQQLLIRNLSIISMINNIERLIQLLSNKILHKEQTKVNQIQKNNPRHQQ